MRERFLEKMKREIDSLRENEREGCLEWKKEKQDSQKERERGKSHFFSCNDLWQMLDSTNCNERDSSLFCKVTHISSDCILTTYLILKTTFVWFCKLYRDSALFCEVSHIISSTSFMYLGVATKTKRFAEAETQSRCNCHLLQTESLLSPKHIYN